MFVHRFFYIFIFNVCLLFAQESTSITIASKLLSFELLNAGDIAINNININISSSDGSSIKSHIIENGRIDAGQQKTIDADLNDVLFLSSERYYLSIYSENNLLVKKAITFIEAAPSVFGLTQNFPNPFNSTTRINYEVPFSISGDIITLFIYDINGKVVKTLVNKQLPPGQYTVHWDGTNNDVVSLSSGIYYYRFSGKNFSETKKLILLK